MVLLLIKLEKLIIQKTYATYTHQHNHIFTASTPIDSALQTVIKDKPSGFLSQTNPYIFYLNKDIFPIILAFLISST